MSASCTILRLITLLFLLAGVLLLRKPVFGQTITAAPTRFPVVIRGGRARQGCLQSCSGLRQALNTAQASDTPANLATHPAQPLVD
jgi:hypothetical protein